MPSLLKFEPFPELKTTRFCLRKLSEKDVQAIFNIRSSMSIAKYLDRPLAKGLQDAEKFIQKINMGISNNELIYWGIFENTSNNMVGTMTLWRISVDGSAAEIGFELIEEFQGVGVMQEVLPAVLSFAFNKMMLSVVEGEVDPNNIKSKVLLKKFGFKETGQTKKTEILSLSKESFIG